MVVVDVRESLRTIHSSLCFVNQQYLLIFDYPTEIVCIIDRPTGRHSVVLLLCQILKA